MNVAESNACRKLTCRLACSQLILWWSSSKRSASTSTAPTDVPGAEPAFSSM